MVAKIEELERENSSLVDKVVILETNN